MCEWKHFHGLVIGAVLLLAGCGGGYGGTSSGGGNSTPPPVPAAPSGVTATAGDTQVVISWTAVTGAASYHAKRSTTAGGPYTQVGAPSSATFTDTGLLDGTKYFYVVAAVNAGGESGNSTEVSATPTLPPPPAVPSGVTATAGDTQIVLSWTAVTGAASYHVKRSTTAGGPYTTVGSPTSATFTNTGLLDGTKYFYVVSAVNTGGESANSTEVSATPAVPPADVTITVDPNTTEPISLWIYGINSYSGGANPPFTLDRAGGNRWTAYNWENNFSNAGSDFGPYSNDTFLDSSTTPGDAVSKFITADQNVGLASLMTVQLQGLVSADANGNVNPPDPSRFKTVVDKKSTITADPFTTTPPTTDANVYMDEFLWTLDQKFTGKNIFDASSAQPTFVSLDNEPELWNSTHLEVQGPTMVTSDAYIAKTITLTEALKDQFPNLVIFGPVHYGFQGIYNWQGELSATPTGSNWFPDKYLTAMKAASTTYGKPLVDDYDFHWYPEVYDAGGTRIVSMSGTTLSDAEVQLIVQAPRDLWDPTFNDANNSNPWIYQELGSTPVRIISRIQSKIASEYPGMKLSITEYEGGGWNHIAGTVAQADMLGIFGVQGLFAANLWPPSGTFDYAVAGFRAFRGFDGAGANFGDTSVSASSSDISKVAVYASTDSTKPGRAVFVAINRTTASHTVAISGLTVSGTASIYQITAASAAGQTPVHPVAAGTMPVSGTSFTVTLPALSVSTIDIE
jgi:hypothetical protein